MLRHLVNLRSQPMTSSGSMSCAMKSNSHRPSRRKEGKLPFRPACSADIVTGVSKQHPMRPSHPVHSSGAESRPTSASGCEASVGQASQQS